MEDGIIKTAPDREKAKSILKMVETTLEMIDTIDPKKFTSHVVKEYYEAIRELITVILLLDGYKTHGEGAHKKLIEYMEKNYGEFRGSIRNYNYLLLRSQADSERLMEAVARRMLAESEKFGI